MRKIMKKKIFLTIAIAIVALVLIATLVIKLWPESNKQNEVKVINKIDAYGYTLEDNETSLHKGYFEDLVTVLKGKKVDEEAYTKLLVQLFVSDFYNLDNKLSKNDVGGVQYILTDAKENMILKAKDTIYRYVESNFDGKRDQKLPVVSDVQITNIEKSKFKYGSTTDDDAYEVTATWTYKEDLGYQTTATFILVHENSKISIAQLD
jgi:hypothetical protein